MIEVGDRFVRCLPGEVPVYGKAVKLTPAGKTVYIKWAKGEVHAFKVAALEKSFVFKVEGGEGE